jgi:hypothetical protein
MNFVDDLTNLKDKHLNQYLDLICAEYLNKNIDEYLEDFLNKDDLLQVIDNIKAARNLFNGKKFEKPLLQAFYEDTEHYKITLIPLHKWQNEYLKHVINERLKNEMA